MDGDDIRRQLKATKVLFQNDSRGQKSENFLFCIAFMTVTIYLLLVLFIWSCQKLNNLTIALEIETSVNNPMRKKQKNGRNLVIRVRASEHPFEEYKNR